MDKKIEDIIASLEAKFNGDKTHDIEVLRQYCHDLPRSDENLAIVTAIGHYVAEKFPDDDAVKEAKKFEESFQRFTQLIDEGQACIKAKQFEGAIEKFMAVIGEVRPAEASDRVYCSFVHPFEEMLFRANYTDDKKIERISSLPLYLYMQTAGAFFELQRYDEAKDKYNDALKLNPVSVAVLFELIQIAKVQHDLPEVRRLLAQVHSLIFTRHYLARFYREHAGLAMMEEKYQLALCLIYLSMEYEDSGQARAQLNSLAKHRGVSLAKPAVDTVKARLGEAGIPVGPEPKVYELAMYIGKQLKLISPDAARMAFSIAYELTHYAPLLKEMESC